jgi:hypothetical protein
LQVGQLVNHKYGTVAPRNDAVVNHTLVGERKAQVCGFYRVNITNKVGYAYIGRCQFFAVPLAAVNPFNRVCRRLFRGSGRGRIW